MLVKLGFSGSIASGKSARSNHLATVVAPRRFTRVRLLNADHIGHQTYLPGTDTYNELVNVFGKGILDNAHHLPLINPAFTGPFGAPAHTLFASEDSTNNPNDHTIPVPLVNRKALGEIVFKDQAAMNTLNGIVWPAIRRTIEKEIHQFESKIKLKDEAQQISNRTAGSGRVSSGAYTDAGFADANVLICEAALLSEAGLDTLFDEVWLVGCDPEEAVRRVMARDKIPEDMARRRVASQKSLKEREAILTGKGFVIDSAFTGNPATVVRPGTAPTTAKRILRTFDTTSHGSVEEGLGELETAFNALQKRWVGPAH